MGVQLPASLVVSGEGIPQVCSRHGRESARAARCRFVSRPPRWTAVLIVAGLLPYLIVVTALRKSVQAPYWPLCAECDVHKRKMLLGGLAGIGVSVALFVVAFSLLGSTTTTVDAYGYATTEPSASAGFGGLLLVVAFVVFVAGAIVAGQGSVPVVARGTVTQDGTFVEFRKSHPLFVQQVTEMLNGLRPAQSYGSAPQPGQGYPAPQPGQGYPAPQPGQGYPAPQPGHGQPPR